MHTRKCRVYIVEYNVVATYRTLWDPMREFEASSTTRSVHSASFIVVAVSKSSVEGSHLADMWQNRTVHCCFSSRRTALPKPVIPFQSKPFYRALQVVILFSQWRIQTHMVVEWHISGKARRSPLKPTYAERALSSPDGYS